MKSELYFARFVAEYRAAKNSDFVRVVGFCAVLAGTRTDNFSSIRISLINARARSRNPDPDIRSHVRLEDQYSPINTTMDMDTACSSDGSIK